MRNRPAPRHRRSAGAGVLCFACLAAAVAGDLATAPAALARAADRVPPAATPPGAAEADRLADLLLHGPTPEADAARAAALWPRLAGRTESLRFRVEFGLLGTVGEGALRTRPIEGGYRIDSETRTRGVARWMYRFDADGWTEIDPAAGWVRRSEASGVERRQRRHLVLAWDRPSARLRLEETGDDPRSLDLPLPPTGRLDPLAGFLEARHADLTAGAQTRFVAFFEDKFLPLTLTAGPAARVAVPAGTFDAVPLSGHVPGDFTGFFRRGGAVTLWVVPGERRLPVRIDVQTKWGTARAILVEADPAP